LQPPPVTGYGRCLSKGYKVLIKRGVNRYKLFRFLNSKVILDEEGLHLDEFLCLFELYYQLSESGDPNFKENLNNIRNESFNMFIKFLSKVKIFPYQPTEKTRQTFQELAVAVSYDKRSYHRIKGQNRNKDFRLVFKDTLLPRRSPSKAYIGIGYKDKGSRREPALDGSPKWQEVATYFGNIEGAEDNPRTSSEKSEEET